MITSAEIAASRGYGVSRLTTQPRSVAPALSASAAIAASRGYGSTIQQPAADALPGNRIPTIEEFPLSAVDRRGRPKVEPWIKGKFTGIRSMSTKLEAQGLYQPKEQEKPNWFWRVLNKLAIPNAFIAGYTTGLAKGEDPLEHALRSMSAMWNNKPEEAEFFKETLVALGMKDRAGKIDVVDVAGLMMDIFLDPTTYLGVGVAGKLGTKGGKVAQGMLRAGKVIDFGEGFTPVAQRLQKLRATGGISQRAAEAVEKGMLAPTMLEQAMLHQRGLIKFMGKPIIRGEKFWARYEPAMMAARDLPILKQLSQTFNPMFKIAPELAHGEMAEAKSFFRKMVGGTAADIEDRLLVAGKILGKVDETTDKAMYMALAGMEIGETTVRGATRAEDVVLSGSNRLRHFLDNESASLGKDTVKELKAIHKAWVANPNVDAIAAEISEKVFRPYKEKFAKLGLDTSQFHDFYVKHLIKKFPGRDTADLALSTGRGAGVTRKPGILQRRTGGKAGWNVVGEVPGKEGGTLFEQGEGIYDLYRRGIKPTVSLREAITSYVDEAERFINQKGMVDSFLGRFGAPVTWWKGNAPRVLKEGQEVWITREVIRKLPTLQKLPEGMLAKGDHLVRIAAEDMDKLVGAGLTDVKAYLLPEAVAEQVNNFFKVTNSDESMQAFSKLWGGYMTLFKKYALGMPGTQFRNAMGAMFNSFLQGVVNPTWYAKAFRETWDYMARGKISADVDALRRSGAQMTRTAEWGRRMGVGPRGLGKGLTAINPFAGTMKRGNENIYLRGVQGMMEFVETSMRLANFKHHKAKGYNNAMAGLKVIESQFSYDPQAWSPAMNTIRRYWVPFASWTASNIPYQVKKLVTEPGLYSVPAKLLVQMEKASPETAEEREYRRPYMSELLAKPLPLAIQKPIQAWLRKVGMTHEGTMYLNPNFPFQDLAKVSDLSLKGLGKEVTSMLNPLVKWVIEGVPYAVGGKSMDFFTGRRISASDLDVAPSWMQWMYQAYPNTRNPIHQLGGKVDKNGVVKISPMALKTLRVFAPPLMIPDRFLPPDKETEKYLAEAGRMGDLYLTRMLSNLFGVKFILPATLSEKKRRLIVENERVLEQYLQAKELGYVFPNLRRGETPQQYEQRIGGM